MDLVVVVGLRGRARERRNTPTIVARVNAPVLLGCRAVGPIVGRRHCEIHTIQAMAPQTVLDKVVSAIETLAEPGGASRPAIAKCVKSLNGGVEVSGTLLKKALVTGVKKGKLVQTGQRFALVGVVLAAKPEDTVEKTILKEGTGAACEAGDEVDMAYVGKLESDGSQFDRAAHFKFVLGGGEGAHACGCALNCRFLGACQFLLHTSHQPRPRPYVCSLACARSHQGMGQRSRGHEGRREGEAGRASKAGLRRTRIRQGDPSELDTRL